MSPSAQPPADDTAGLGRIFVLIVLVEALSIAALYAFGVLFA
jgi:hypothetical protein